MPNIDETPRTNTAVCFRETLFKIIKLVKSFSNINMIIFVLYLAWMYT